MVERCHVLVLDCNEAPYSLVAAKALCAEGCVVSLGFNVDLGKIPYKVVSGLTRRGCIRRTFFYPDPLRCESAFVNSIMRFVSQERCTHLLPCLEKTQLAVAKLKRALEDEYGVEVPIPPYEVLEFATRKDKVLELAMKLGISIPRTRILRDHSAPDLKELKRELGLPFIMKVSKEIGVPPGPGRRYYVVDERTTERQFRIAYLMLRRHGPVIAQEYIQGVGVGAAFVFSKKGELVAYTGHRRILEAYFHGGPSVVAVTELNVQAVLWGYVLLKSLRWQGVAMAEYKLSNQGLYFMELNPRFWGTLPLAIASGVNFPALLIKYYSKIEDSKEEREVYAPTLRTLFILGKRAFMKSIEHYLRVGGTKGLGSLWRSMRALVHELGRVDLWKVCVFDNYLTD